MRNSDCGFLFDMSSRSCAFLIPQSAIRNSSRGEVQEWLNWQHWKCCERGTVPWVRIPPSPPQEFRIANCELRIWNLEFEISGSSERDPNQNDQLKQKEDGSV